MLTSRSLSWTVPSTSTSDPMSRCSTMAVRRPSACTACAETLRPELSSAPSSAYLGTSAMYMEGDLPGLSNFCVGTMGSYQYSTLRSAFAVSAEVGTVPEAWLLAVRHWETPQPRAMPVATNATATTVFLKTVLVMWFSLQSAIRLFRRAITVSRCACSSMSRQCASRTWALVASTALKSPLADW